MRTVDVVIIGAGVIGASVAYHLAKRGCRNVLVLDQNSKPGEGSTLKATGGFRCQFGSDINVRLSLLSRQKLKSFSDELGIDPGYRPCGYLFLAMQEEVLRALQSAQAIQKNAGLMEVQQIGQSEIADLNPAIDVNQIAGGVYCETDGFIRAGQILKGYVDSAEQLGVEFQYGVGQTGFKRNDPNKISSVETTAGNILAGMIVNAAGAWAGRVAEAADSAIPVRPLRRQVAVTKVGKLLPEDMPMTVYADDGFHLRVRDGRVLLLWPDEAVDADPYDTSVTDEWIGEVKRKAESRIPKLRNVAIDRENCWAGLYEMSPDKHALLGRSNQIENFYLINGSSGHGVMHAPALGQLLTEIMLDGKATTLDVHALRPSRFEEGKPIVGAQLL